MFFGMTPPFFFSKIGWIDRIDPCRYVGRRCGRGMRLTPAGWTAVCGRDRCNSIIQRSAPILRSSLQEDRLPNGDGRSLLRSDGSLRIARRAQEPRAPPCAGRQAHGPFRHFRRFPGQRRGARCLPAGSWLAWVSARPRNGQDMSPRGESAVTGRRRAAYVLGVHHAWLGLRGTFRGDDGLAWSTRAAARRVPRQSDALELRCKAVSSGPA
jgi:hypothetical protein